MLDPKEIPSTTFLRSVVIYVAAVIALGISFSFTLGLMNTEFEMGVIGSLVNVYLSFRLFRHIAVQHFTETP
jgi:hypothetical protein